MRQLILIKHAKPQVQEDVPSREWGLSEEGRLKAAHLAERITSFDPALVVSSDEPKALETATILSNALGKPLESARGLEEHDRANVPMMASREFISLMALFFKQRTRLVLGLETAAQATTRITDAVDGLLLAHPQGNLAVVTHGTVLALLVAERAHEDAFGVWRRMALPSYAVFNVPEWDLVKIVDRVE